MPFGCLRRRDERGQSLVEFALLLPLLLILLVGIADFGRVFQAAIVTESAARAAAEAGAVEYLRSEEARLANPGDPDYYERIHDVASAAACREAQILPNTTYAAPGVCGGWPAVLVCVHDGLDPICDDDPADGFTAGSAECTRMTGSWSTATGPHNEPWVEVRACYRFTTLFNLNVNLPFNAGLRLGEVFLQQRAAFTVADY